MPTRPDLDRFVRAQDQTYPNVLAELARGKKATHWMWYVFPQLAGLGSSTTAREFAIQDLGEARRYLEHPILGPRLTECVELVLAVRGRSAADIFGDDDKKLGSCATLFAEVSPSGSLFHELLDRYFGGKADERTLNLLDEAAKRPS